MTSSLDAFFQPRSIAVIGASRRPDTIGYQIVDNLLRHGYTGVVYPVNPGAVRGPLDPGLSVGVEPSPATWRWR